MNYSHLHFILAQDAAPAPAEGPGGFGLGGFPFIILMFVMVYFMMIRPQRKKQKELQNMIESLKSGDLVVTIGGIHGMVTNFGDGTVTLKVADNTKMKFDKSSIGKVVKKKEDEGGAEAPAIETTEAETAKSK